MTNVFLFYVPVRSLNIFLKLCAKEGLTFQTYDGKDIVGKCHCVSEEIKLKISFLDKEVVLIGDENGLTIIVPIGRFMLFVLKEISKNSLLR